MVLIGLVWYPPALPLWRRHKAAVDVAGAAAPSPAAVAPRASLFVLVTERDSDMGHAGAAPAANHKLCLGLRPHAREARKTGLDALALGRGGVEIDKREERPEAVVAVGK
jgi:hypothetical protein